MVINDFFFLLASCCFEKAFELDRFMLSRDRDT